MERRIHDGSRRRTACSPSALILFCFFLSGFAGLIYEVIWVRIFERVIGSAPFAIATVLAVFMTGLALGSYLAGKYVDRFPSKGSLLFLYGIVEVLIGAFGLILPLLITWIEPVYSIAYNQLFQYFWPYQILTFLGCFLLLIVPTTLMGITLPVLCRFYVIQMEHLSMRTGRLYGINTVGAAVGTLLAGFFLINNIGVWGTLFVAAAINFFVGVLCIVISRVWQLSCLFGKKDFGHELSLEEAKPESSALEVKQDLHATWGLVIFAVSGFSAMAYEVIWVRLLGLIMGPTTYSFTLVISTFIIGLALGSLFFGWLGDRVKRVFSLLVLTQIAASCLALIVSHILGNSQLFFAKLIYTFQDNFVFLMLLQFSSVFFILLCPTVLFGATFPLVNRLYARSLPFIGKSVGNAYALNTIGAIAGSLTAGFLLIPLLGKENGLRFVMALQFSLAVAAFVSAELKKKDGFNQLLTISVVASLGLLLCFNLPSWNRQSLSHGRYRDFSEIESSLATISWRDALTQSSTILTQHEAMREIVFYGDGIGGFTTVIKSTDALGTENYTLLNSGKPDASSHGDRATQTLSAHVPLLFHPNADKIMVLGLAGGMTAGEVLHYPVKNLDVLEINEQVVEACKIFTPWNNGVLNDPRTRIIVQDGRNHLALTRETYDVIISEPSNPWMAGLANLYTLEFFQTVKDRLRADGIFVQWIHSYEMDWPTFALAGRTFTKVFPNSLLMTTMPWESGDYLLVGFLGQRKFDLEVANKNIHYLHRSVNISLTNPKLLFDLIITEDLADFFGPGPIHEDNWPRLEYAAPKRLYGGDLSLRKRIEKSRWLSPNTEAILDAENPAETILDFIDFSVTAHANIPNFGIFDVENANPSQKKRLNSSVTRYCSQRFIDNYSIFQNHTLRALCATVQVKKIRQNIAIHPDNALAYSGLGFSLLELGNLDEAIQALKKATSLMPFDFSSRNNLGAALSHQGRYEEAVIHFLEAVRIEPDDAKAHSNLGVAFLRLGRYEEAVTHFLEAVRIEPKSEKARHKVKHVLKIMEKSGNISKKKN